jgi:thiazole synthase
MTATPPRTIATPADSHDDSWTLGGHRFQSRIIVGTGKYASIEETRDAIAASGAEMVTVALRRVDLTSGGPTVLDAIDRSRLVLLPNTAGCYTADEAVRTLHLARELGMDDFVKLEVIGDPKTLFPDNAATVEAAARLVKEGFRVLPYCSDDLVTCKKLEAVGCLAVMPLAAPIGSGLGIRNPHNIRLIIENVGVPVIVDAGVGTASDAAIALELGCTAVLMNTGIAAAQKPVLMAEAMRLAVDAGRKAFRAGRMPVKSYANASSPTGGLIE